jgi:hypothetical protein
MRVIDMYFACELDESPSAPIVAANGTCTLSILVENACVLSSLIPCDTHSFFMRGREAAPTVCIVHSLS